MDPRHEFGNSGLQTPRTRQHLVSIRCVFGNMPTLQAAVHHLTPHHHRSCGFLVSADKAIFCGLQIDFPRDNGDDHNDGADAERSNGNGEVLRHGEITVQT